MDSVKNVRIQHLAKIKMTNKKSIKPEKYELLHKSLEAVSKGTINLLILKGLSGTGKTYATLKYAKKNELSYEYINNYATPLAFYKLLYKNRNKAIIIFDDLQSMGDPKIKSMFKSVCGELEDGKRIVSYYSTSPILEKEGLPDSFELTVKPILIFNEDISGFESIVNRGVTIDFNFSFKEMLEVLQTFQEDAGIEQEVMDYVKENCNQATNNLSIRTLVMLSKLKRDGYNFELFAREILKTDEGMRDLIELDEKSWCDKTGQSRRTYYRHRKSAKVS